MARFGKLPETGEPIRKKRLPKRQIVNYRKYNLSGAPECGKSGQRGLWFVGRDKILVMHVLENIPGEEDLKTESVMKMEKTIRAEL